VVSVDHGEEQPVDIAENLQVLVVFASPERAPDG
jgi:hypothetical protein